MTHLAPLAPQGCGCESVTPPAGLARLDTVFDWIAQVPAITGPSRAVGLAEALGCVLANPVFAASDQPPFAASAMDGYALDTAAMTGPGPWTLRVAGQSAAGHVDAPTVNGRSAVQIFTGAPVPNGANAVIMQEHVTRLDTQIEITTKPTIGQNIRQRGEELSQDTVVLAGGQRLGPREIAACAVAGQNKIPVHRTLRVALVTTGDEVHSPGALRSEAGIWDVNGAMLTAALQTCGDVQISHVHCADTLQGITDCFETLKSDTDLIITTGGISVGATDHVKPALTAAGGQIAISGVAIKPGKPISLGSIGDATWLGLPGNPLSAFVTWTLFGRPLLDRLSGVAHPSGPSRRHVLADADLHHSLGRCELRLAKRAGFDARGREIVTCPNTTHSGRIATLHSYDGVVFLPADNSTFPQGDLLEFLPFSCD